MASISFSSFAAAAEPQPFYQGFETDSAGWVGANRVASGTGGIDSRAGAFHAEATPGAFTQWGGYTNEFPDGGYTTSVWIYLDPTDTALANDTRFDYTSAVSTPAGTHRRDFVFNGGFYNDTDATGSGPRFVFSASNNTGRSAAFPKNPAREPFTIVDTGWYEFRHVFYDNGSGVLAVDLQIWSSTGSLLKSWTLSDPTDVIAATVGGNRYGWFPNQEFDVLAIDETRLSVAPKTPESADDCKDGGWMTLVDDDGNAFRNQGQCIKHSNGAGNDGDGGSETVLQRVAPALAL
jgi:hypothetical protein